MSSTGRRRIRRTPPDDDACAAAPSRRENGRPAPARPLTPEQRVAFLSQAGALLAASLDYEATLQRVAELVVPTLADYCVIDLRQGDGTLRHVAVAQEPAMSELLRGVQDYRRDLWPEEPAERVLREGRALLIPAVPDALLQRIARSDQHLAVLRAVDPRSLMVVPLRARERTLGSISLVLSREDEVYDAADLALAEELALRAALAVDNARLYEQARQASRARDEVLSIVSHDLRNPLGVVMMSTAMLLEENLGEEQRRGYLEIVQQAAERMQRLIDDLLQVMRLESGRLQLDLYPQPAASLVREAVHAFGVAAAGRGLRLESELPPGLPAVLADRDRVLQVFGNLIDNALKFTPTGGQVLLAAAAVNGGVEFSVRDTGPGVAADALPHLFDRFWQARRSRAGGVGLGLAIARGIVEAHGGTMRAESEEGHGAAFRFTLPLAAGGATASPGTGT